MKTFKFRARRTGEHVHVDVFVMETIQPHEGTYALAGRLVFRPAEWSTFRRGLVLFNYLEDVEVEVEGSAVEAP